MRKSETRMGNLRMPTFTYVANANSGWLELTDAKHSFHQVDRQKVLTIGQQVMGKLLLELQTRKSTADGEGAREFYTELTDPLSSWAGELRDLVIAKKQVRSRYQRRRTSRFQIDRLTDSFGVCSWGKNRHERSSCNQISSSWMVTYSSRSTNSALLVPSSPLSNARSTELVVPADFVIQCWIYKSDSTILKVQSRVGNGSCSLWGALVHRSCDNSDASSSQTICNRVKN